MAQPTDAAHDLLFGLVALQNGLIDQAQLVAAFQAWTRDKARPLADHLAALGHLDGGARGAVEAMAGSHLRKHGSDVQRSLAALPRSRTAFARLAALGDPQVEATLTHLGTESTVEADAADRTPTCTVGTHPADVRRFRILRPHARGGRGTVSIALDTELHREVALKQILDRYRDDPTSRIRFVREAEITGGLEHPGIVAVYGLGQDSDGRPYYAMRFIRGESLRRAIAAFHADPVLRAEPGRRSLALRRLLRRFLDVCNAIDYAHSRGVLHRDIKPSNIILGKHGETFVVDWGLAKATGQTDPACEERSLVLSQDSGGDAETLPGAAIGTPAFMSPEQARGDLRALGPHSDVYSLGVTLYCLLTGRAPFEDADPGSVLRAVQRAEYPRCRSLDPSIDRALEAICLKAMAADPRDRYATARLLAEDIERWLADEPVSAWHEPRARRVLRWARHRRATVTAAAATVLVALIGTAAVLAVQTRANIRLRRANVALGRANVALRASYDRESARFDLARGAIRLFHGEVSQDLLLKQAQFQELRTKLLRGAAAFYGHLEAALEGQADRASRMALGQSYFDLGDLTAEIGDKAEALAIHRKALALRRSLASGPGADAAARLDVARSLLAAGYLQFETGDNRGAHAALDEARHVAEPLVGSAGVADEARLVLGLTYFRTSYVLDYVSVAGYGGGPSPALDASSKGVAVLRELAKAHPHDTEIQRNLALLLNNTGNLLWELNRLPEALAIHGEALVIRQRLVYANPNVPRLQRDLAATHNNIGLVWEMMGRPSEALAAHGEALAIWRRLGDTYPTVTQFQIDLGESYYNIGQAQWQLGRKAEALAAYRAALAVQTWLVETHPEVPDYLRELARTLTTMGRHLLDEDRLDEAADCFRQAAAYLERLPDLRGIDYLNLIRNHALIVGLADRPGSGFSAAEAKEARERAMHWLRRSIDHPDADSLRTDPDFEPLRGRPDFELHLMDLAFSAADAAPFAR